MQSNYRMNFAEELKKCVKCGTCRATCPVFTELRGEPAAPRGRLALIKQLQEGEIEPSEELADIIHTCLLCKSCTVNCPSGVIGDEIITAARDYLNHTLDQSLMQRILLKSFLTRPALLYSSMALARLYQRTGLHNVLTRSNLINHLPEKITAAVKIMPDVTKKPASDRIPEVTPARGDKKYKVAFYLGCATNLIYPDVPVAAVEVLSRHGCEVVTPSTVKCCGMPHLAYGETDTMLELAKHNLEVLLAEDYDAIISDCASCCTTLAETYEKLFKPGTPEHEKAKTLGTKVYDVNKFLVEKTGIKPGNKPVDVKVTYHDPCHLKRSLNIYKEPREVLKSIPGVEFKEMKEADRCCGCAGSFTVMHHDVSMKILDKKIENVTNSGATVLATSCPTCTMQLSYGLKKNGSSAPVVHPVQLLAQTYLET